jgi:hypothetical protein
MKGQRKMKGNEGRVEQRKMKGTKENEGTKEDEGK